MSTFNFCKAQIIIQRTAIGYGICFMKKAFLSAFSAKYFILDFRFKM